MIILPDPPYTDAPRGSQRQCAYTFPGAPNFNGSATPIPAVTSFNNLYKGVNMKGANLFFANGQREFCFLASRRSLPKHWRGCRRSMEGCDRLRRWTVRRQHLNAANWCLRWLPLLRPHHQERSNRRYGARRPEARSCGDQGVVGRACTGEEAQCSDRALISGA